VDKRIEDIIDKMSLEEKVRQLIGNGLATYTNDQLQIPEFQASDCPVGTHREGLIYSYHKLEYK
jgi:hypothetical protein